MPDTDRQPIATRCGLAAPAVALGSLLLATIVASSEVIAGEPRLGLASIWLGIVHPVTGIA